MHPSQFAPAPRAAGISFFEGESSFTSPSHREDARASHFAFDSDGGNGLHHDEGAEHARRIAELHDFFVGQYGEFSRRLEGQLEVFYEQTASRLDALAGQIIHHFAEELNAQAGHALNALMTDWAEQNRALVDAECHRALDQFSARLQAASIAHVENYHKEMQNLSSNLKSRLRSVAHALQDIGPASHRG